MTAELSVCVLCDADVIELHRRWPAEAICRVPGGVGIDATPTN
jgi:hypothetical protein